MQRAMDNIEAMGPVAEGYARKRHPLHPSQSSRSSNVRVAAPLPRSAHHAVTLASLVGNDGELDELSDTDIAQAHEAYSYSRAVLAHMAGQSGSSPPPAPSSGKGLGAPQQQQQAAKMQQAPSALVWSPSLLASSFSNPSTPSLSSPSRPRSSSTRNSFSSIGASSADYDRSSWGTRPSSIGVSARRLEGPFVDVSDPSGPGKRASLGSRRKSVEFAVKAMGRWARRKNSTSAVDESGLPVMKASGEPQYSGDASTTTNTAKRNGGTGGNGGSSGSYGWGGTGGISGGGGGMAGGDGGDGGGGGGRAPGGGYINGRTSPPIQSVFRRLELAGRGAYGAVYRGVHVASGAAVALKVINLDTPEDDVSDIQREVALLSQLRETSTKNVVKYWGCWLKGSELWIVMDFAEGGSVRTLMKAGPVAEKYSAVIVRESLVALSYLHRSGIIHRDIKAANILLTTSGKVLLCDFGVAASLVSSSVHSKRSTFVGTPYWMAPEVITQGKTYDQSADIWSLGITIYEMVTGNPPLSDQEQMRAIMLIPKSKPPRLPADGNYSTLLREFVGLCLNEEPKERPGADELAKSKWIKASSKASTAILRDLIANYAAWTKSGGMRMSLIGAEAGDLNEAGNRDSFAFDGVAGEEGWEFNTVNSRSMDWSGEQVETPLSAPVRDHPLLRLFQEGSDESQPTVARGTKMNGTAMAAPPPPSSAPMPSSTYMGADIRPAPLPPGPIPERPPLAALTSAGLAADKGSFTGMGATPFRFGGGGGQSEQTASPSAEPSTPNSASPFKQTMAETPILEENVGGESSMNNSSFGFHQSAGTSSANTSFSTANHLQDMSKENEAMPFLPPTAPFLVHERNGSGLSASSSALANDGGRAISASKQRQGSFNHSRNDSASQHSHSRDRSETSASANMSVSSERRNQIALNPATPLSLQRPHNEARREGGVGALTPSLDGSSASNRHQAASSQSLGYPSQRSAHQVGVRSRSGSRSKPLDGVHLEHEWSSHGQAGGASHQQPPMPSRSAALSNVRGVMIPAAAPHQLAGEVGPAGLHQRRQHGGSDPTQLLNRASRDMTANQDVASHANLAGWMKPSHPSGAPRLRSLDLNTLVERDDVHLELERTVEDLGVWLDVVGSGLARIAAK